jgi:predicted metalloprotease
LALFLTAAVVASGCAATVTIETTSVRTDRDGTAAGTPDDSSTDEPLARPPLAYEEAIDIYLADVESFWAEVLEPTFGVAFSPVDEVLRYSPLDETTLPECDGDLGPLDLYDDNAFYCAPDDFIAWDDVGLFPDLYGAFGAFALGLVIAHEYGHAAQARADLVGPDLLVEIQADCFAGGWAASLVGSESPAAIRVRDLDAAVGGFLSFADPVATPLNAPEAHGSAFDRLSAFAEGFDEGVVGCADYLDDPPELTNILVPTGFDSGNMALDDLLPRLIEDLALMFPDLTPSDGASDVALPTGPTDFTSIDEFEVCGGSRAALEAEVGAFFCTEDRAVYVNGPLLNSLWRDGGDFAAAYVVLHAYATAATVATSSGSVHERVLIADCLVGVWTRRWYENSFLPLEQQAYGLELSPGDLDEGIIGLLALEPVGPSLAELVHHGVFERSQAFRSGFFAGPAECDLS